MRSEARSGVVADAFVPRMLIVVLGALSTQAALPSPRSPVEPNVLVREEVIDLGIVSAGLRPTAEFALENRGGGVLELLGVEASCRCTLADFDRSIAPGKAGFVRVSLDTAELQGAVTKGIVVRTNDPQRPQIVLTLKATVLQGVELLPQPVIFMRSRAGAPPVGRLLVHQADPRAGTLALSDLEASSRALAVSATRLDELRPRGGGLPEGRPGDWIIEVRFSENPPSPRALRESVRFRTGLAAQPEMRAEVEWNGR